MLHLNILYDRIKLAVGKLYIRKATKKGTCRRFFLIKSIEYLNFSHFSHKSGHTRGYPQPLDMETEFDLNDLTDSFLVLYGSADSDVSGEKTDGIMRTGCKFFDDVATESSYFYNNQAPN